jgi:hypothetical protein
MDLTTKQMIAQVEIDRRAQERQDAADKRLKDHGDFWAKEFAFRARITLEEEREANE